MKWAMWLALAAAIGVTGVQAAETANPVADFLKAADNGDIPTMQALLKDDVATAEGGRLSPSEFFQHLENCYLRRVYADTKAPGKFKGAWMCSVPGDDNQSGVLLVDIANTDRGLQISGLFETHSKRPAPSRNGSEFQ